MDDINHILEFAETLIHEKTGAYCSDLQRQILLTALRGERKTYDQLAKASGYSSRYVRQDVAPKLWQLLSEALGQKVAKSNIRFLLEKEMHSSPSVPAVLSKDDTPPIAKISSKPAATVSPLSSVKPLSTAYILLVDDQPQNLRVLSDLLEEQGYRARQAISGEIALEAIADEKPALVLLDIHMPEMDGYGVCQRIKTNPATQDIPVIFVSALDETWDKVKAFSVGGADYIHKPFKVVEVLARVENQLKVGQLQRVLEAQNEQLQQALHTVQQLAAIDETTQVASRRRFDQSLLENWQRALETRAPLTLMLCQIGNFNVLAEEATPRRMDERLYQVAQALKAASGADALVCRYSVITFAIVLPQQALAAGEAIAQTVLEQMQELAIASPKSPVTLSIGLATAHPTPDLDLEEAMLEPCELRLQQAKGKGGNCWVSS